jgi:hypothetical protein
LPFFFALTSFFTKAILNPILHPPMVIEYNIYLKNLPATLVALYLFLCFSWFLTIHHLKNYKSQYELIKWV